MLSEYTLRFSTVDPQWALALALSYKSGEWKPNEERKNEFISWCFYYINLHGGTVSVLWGPLRNWRQNKADKNAETYRIAISTVLTGE